MVEIQEIEKNSEWVVCFALDSIITNNLRRWFYCSHLYSLFWLIFFVFFVYSCFIFENYIHVRYINYTYGSCIRNPKEARPKIQMHSQAKSIWACLKRVIWFHSNQNESSRNGILVSQNRKYLSKVPVLKILLSLLMITRTRNKSVQFECNWKSGEFPYRSSELNETSWKTTSSTKKKLKVEFACATCINIDFEKEHTNSL